MSLLLLFKLQPPLAHTHFPSGLDPEHRCCFTGTLTVTSLPITQCGTICAAIELLQTRWRDVAVQSCVAEQVPVWVCCIIRAEENSPHSVCQRQCLPIYNFVPLLVQIVPAARSPTNGLRDGWASGARTFSLGESHVRAASGGVYIFRLGLVKSHRGCSAGRMGYRTFSATIGSLRMNTSLCKARFRNFDQSSRTACERVSWHVVMRRLASLISSRNTTHSDENDLNDGRRQPVPLFGEKALI
jgi:hypothetical protein